jgi:uncharacterized alkaline shock family protein YloU
VPTDPIPGRSLIARRAIADVVRAATLGSYGVTGFDGGTLNRVLGALGLGPAGLHIDLKDGLSIELDLRVAYGLPVAEVARQVDSAVRYAIRRALDREVDRLTIHVGGLSYEPGSLPPVAAPPPPDAVAPAELADSGMDVA